MKKTVQDSESGENSYGPPEGVKLNNRVVRAKILDINEQESIYDLDPDDPSKGKKQQISFKFECAEEIPGWEKSVGAWFWGSTGDKLTAHPNCKLYNWVCAIYGVESLAKDIEIDFDEMVGEEVNILLTVSKSNKPRVRDILMAD